MKYWEFDVARLIADYQDNKNRLVSIQEAMQVARGYIENPVDESRGDWAQYYIILELREKEYQMYVDMVDLGFERLPEIERNVLKFWLLEGYSDKYIMDRLEIDGYGELKKIKKIAITRFVNIVMPD